MITPKTIQNSKSKIQNPKSNITRVLFIAGLIGKGFDSLLEIVGGILLLTPVTVNKSVEFLFEHEWLHQWTHPTLAKAEHSLATGIVTATVGTAVYLMLHGIAKVVLIAEIFLGKRWAYVTLIAVLSVFAIIEGVKGALDQHWLVILFAAGDVILVFLIWKELKVGFVGDKSR